MNSLGKWTVIVLLTGMPAAHAQAPMETKPDGTTARFHQDDVRGQIVEIPRATRDTVICTFRSPAPANNCFRLINTSGTPVSTSSIAIVHTQDYVTQSLQYFQNQPGMEACEIVDPIWSGWNTVGGSVPVTPGTTYEEERFCSEEPATGIVPACGGACPVSRESRMVTVCSYGPWVPGTDTVQNGVSFEQTRAILSGTGCAVTTRTVTGTASNSCRYGTWRPDTDTVEGGQSFQQTRPVRSGSGCTDTTRITTGTGPVSCDYGDWRPDTDTVEGGQPFSQTRPVISGSGCTVTTRPATGTGPTSCDYGAWRPPASTVDDGLSFTQSRSVINGFGCTDTTRTATGTKPTRCSYGSWGPPESSYDDGVSFTQTRPVLSGTSCSVTSQLATGTRPVACTYGSWTPPESSYDDGVGFTQTRPVLTGSGCADTSQPATGTRPVACTFGSWSPQASTIRIGQAFTQTRPVLTGTGCSPTSRTAPVPGTMACQVTAWAPPLDPRTYPIGETRTQTRTAPNCSAERRDVPGTRPPVIEVACQYGAWTPSEDSMLMGLVFPQTRPVTGGDPAICTETHGTGTGKQPLVIRLAWGIVYTVGNSGGSGPSGERPGTSCSSAGASGDYTDSGGVSHIVSCLPAN